MRPKVDPMDGSTWRLRNQAMRVRPEEAKGLERAWMTSRISTRQLEQGLIRIIEEE